MLDVKMLKERDICRALFDGFERRQVVTDCWRREGGRWVIRREPFVDQWSEEDYRLLVRCLQNTAKTGGAVFGAFEAGRLLGFGSVEAGPLGPRGEYLDLSCLHVSEQARGKGLGRRLFEAAADWARERGAEKLYISSHSAVETQAFYQAMGCVDAGYIHEAHTLREPFDRQLEYVL